MEGSGVSFNVGEFPDKSVGVGDTEDPYRVAELTAHALARVADRFTFLRKLSRHMEGKERRAGLLSDLAGVAWELYRRNPDTFQQIFRSYTEALTAKRAAASAAKAGSPNGFTPNQQEGHYVQH